MRSFKYLLILFFLIVIDLGSKIVVEKTRISHEIITNIISISYIENLEAYFAILSGNSSSLILMVIKTVILMLFVFVVSRANGYGLLKLGFILMLAGNLGNLIDVLVDNGVAIDWIVLGNQIAINLADFYMLVGIGMIAWLLISWLFAGCLTKNILEIVRL